MKTLTQSQREVLSLMSLGAVHAKAVNPQILAALIRNGWAEKLAVGILSIARITDQGRDALLPPAVR